MLVRIIILTIVIVREVRCLSPRRMTNSSVERDSLVQLSLIPTALRGFDGQTKALQLTADVVFVHLDRRKTVDPVSSIAFRNALITEDKTIGFSITSADGTTRVEKSYIADIYCAIRYSLYPFERPLCRLEITTVVKTANELKLGWIAQVSEDAVLEAKEVGDYLVDWVDTDYCALQRPIANTKTSTVFAKFPCLSWSIQLFRPLCVLLITQFIPSIIIVAVTWTVHYIDREKPTMRLLVCSAAACGIVYIIERANRQRPPTSSITAIDVWAIICLAFVGITFIQIILCHVMTKQSRKQRGLARKGSVRVESRQRRERRLIQQNNLSSSASRPQLNGKTFDQSKNSKDTQKLEAISNYDTLVERHFIGESDYWSVMAVRTDLAARVLNPVCFVIAVSLYFVFYVVL